MYVGLHVEYPLFLSNVVPHRQIGTYSSEGRAGKTKLLVVYGFGNASGNDATCSYIGTSLLIASSNANF
jgi:hypothetical protein